MVGANGDTGSLPMAVLPTASLPMANLPSGESAKRRKVVTRTELPKGETI